MENGRRHFFGRFSSGDDFESDTRPGDSRMAICSPQRRLQCLRRGAPGLGRHASGHPPAARLAATAIPNKRQNHVNTKSPPDLILQNGHITTLEARYPVATNVTIKDGRIIGVDDAESYERGPNTKVIDLKGRRVIP